MGCRAFQKRVLGWHLTRMVSCSIPISCVEKTDTYAHFHVNVFHEDSVSCLLATLAESEFRNTQMILPHGQDAPTSEKSERGKEALRRDLWHLREPSVSRTSHLQHSTHLSEASRQNQNYYTSAEHLLRTTLTESEPPRQSYTPSRNPRGTYQPREIRTLRLHSKLPRWVKTRGWVHKWRGSSSLSRSLRSSSRASLLSSSTRCRSDEGTDLKIWKSKGPNEEYRPAFRAR